MEKHAYLFMVHGNWSVFKKCLLLIDDIRNDIFIHVDLKAKDFKESEIVSLIKKSKVYFINRVSVKWAAFSQVQVTIDLLKNSMENGKYCYFHLLSGADLPLKTQDQIYEFFQKHEGKEFIGIVPKQSDYTVKRFKYYHPLVNCDNYRTSKTLKAFTTIFEKIQKMCGVNRLRGKEIYLVDGWTWFSITHKFANYIIDNYDYIEKIFSSGIAADEVFVQTMAYNSDFKENIYDLNNLRNGSMRLIDWKRGRPYTFKKGDYMELIESPYLFARKFDEKIDVEIVNMIFKEINNKQN